MTETPIVDTGRGFAARLKRTRFATRAAMTLERLWPLVLPLIVVVSLFLSLSWLGLFRILPDMLRLVLTVAFAAAAIAALYPLRFFRRPDRPRLTAASSAPTQLEHTPVLVQTDRLTGKEDDFSQALWREHQRRMAEKLGQVGSDLPRTTVPERDPWALRAAAALLFVTAFAFSLGPLGGSITDAFRAPCGARCRPAAHRRMGDAAGLHRQGADIPDRASRPAGARLYGAGRAARSRLRVTGGSGEETLGFTDSSGKARDLAPNDPIAAQAKPAGSMAIRAIRRQARRRWRAGAEIGRTGTGEMVVCRDA